MIRRAVAVAVLGALLSSTLGSGARAHERPPRRDALVVAADGVTVACALAIAPGAEARALAEQFDRDRSSSLDAGERAALLRFLTERAARYARLSVDGCEVTLADAGADLELPPAVDAVEARGLTVIVHRRAALRLDDRPHRLAFSDRAPDARVTVAVELRSDGVRLTETPRAPIVFADHPLVIATSPP